ncbi:uncharacterized protein [Henckelia pumila]|uniref:uncharacterized protein n=1 Tax=Henckelia pumila TaxID=405737 RepID=UPI003C6E3429
MQPPGTVLQRFEMLCAKFIWGAKEGNKKIHWVAWKKICLPVSEGGLGIRRLKDSMTAFSIKLWFRFRSVESQWGSFLVKRYCKFDPPAAVRLMQNISPTWRRMMNIRNKAEQEIGWRIGDGQISFWFDSWFPDGIISSLAPIQGHQSRLVDWFVGDRKWNLARLLLVVPPDLAHRILDNSDGCQVVGPSCSSHLSLFFAGVGVWNFFGCHFRVQNFHFFANWMVSNGWSRNGHIRELISFLIIWFLWKARNDHKHKGIRIHSARIIQHILDFILSIGRSGLLRAIHWGGFEDVATSMELSYTLSRTTYIRTVRWLAPNFGFFRLNTYGCSKFGGESVDSLAALAILDADFSSWELMGIVTKIQSILKTSLVRKSHIFRKANGAADELDNLGVVSGSAILHPADIVG